MADRTTTVPSGAEKPAGAGPEARAASAGPGDAESLRGRAEAAEHQRDDYLGLLQRTRADFENYQKRVQRDLTEERRQALAGFARELLPVVDNLKRALDAAPERGEHRPLVQGVALVQSQLLDVFRRSGIIPIEALDRAFDPNLHQAVRQEARDDVTPGTVIAVLEPGYRLDDRVLRPASVVVAAPSAS